MASKAKADTWTTPEITLLIDNLYQQIIEYPNQKPNFTGSIHMLNNHF
jgi:hypothetical protein